MFSRKRIAIVLGAAIFLAAFKDPSKAASGDGVQLSEAPLVAVTYAVADLVIPVDMEPGEKKGKPQSREDELMKLIRATVAPESWSEKGGQAQMQYFSIGMGLMIQQTPAAHEKIRTVLKDLRHLQDIEIGVEVHIASLSEEYKDKFEAVNPLKDSQGNYRLTRSQVLEFAKYTQQDRANSFLGAPKLTVFNGQKAMIAIMDQEAHRKGNREEGAEAVQQEVEIVSGFRFYVRPTVSSDRKEISMNLGVFLANQDGKNYRLPKIHKLEMEKTLKLADGETALIYMGKDMVESRRNEPNPVILSKIRYMDRLFANTSFGPELANLYVVVTPRLIIVDEEGKVAVRK
jgi:Bacterial type II and III secretion system protein